MEGFESGLMRLDGSAGRPRSPHAGYNNTAVKTIALQCEYIHSRRAFKMYIPTHAKIWRSLQRARTPAVRSFRLACGTARMPQHMRLVFFE